MIFRHRPFLLGIVILMLATVTFAQDIPPVIPNTYVQDHSGVLDSSDEKLIQEQLNQFKAKYNLEIGVATVRSTEPYAIQEFATKMAREYGIGSKDNEKRGILLLLATSDKKWRIEISRHVEGILTDGQSGQIGRNVLVPKLKVASTTGKSADWREAVTATLGAIDTVMVKRAEPEVVAAPVQNSSSGFGFLIFLGFAGLIGLAGGGLYLVHRHRRNVRKAIEEQRIKSRLAAEAEDRERERLARELKEAEHQKWLKTPEGIAWQAEEDEKARKREEARLAAIEAERKRQEEHRKWLLTPEGLAYTAEQARIAKHREDEARERRRREEQEEEERAARRRSESSYSSSSSSDWGSSSSSSSSSSSYDSGSSSSGFSGGSDYGGGGSDGSW